MARFGFCGPSYQSQSLNANAQMCRNWYVERDESGSGKSDFQLLPTPGLKQFAIATDRPVRALFAVSSKNLSLPGYANRVFAVAGNVLLEVIPNGTTTTISSTLANDYLPAQIVGNQTQLLILAAGRCYVLNISAANGGLTFVPLATPVNISQIGYTDGYFLALQQDSQKFQISGLLDAASWNALDVGQVSVFPDNIVSMIVDHREVWFFGRKSSVVYYNTGGADFPFSPIPGAFIEQGAIAMWARDRVDNSIFWLGGDERGAGVAWRAQGYNPIRISNHAVETEWQGYSTITDATSYAYQDQGHTFWVVRFPSANTTWVYDVSTGMWHERAFWDKTQGVWTSHRSQCHVYGFDRHLVGDWATGNIYEMSVKIPYDIDILTPIKRVRRAPHISSEQEWIFHHQLQIDLETGLGPDPPLLDGAFKARDPQIFLRWSDDGGHTWSNEYMLGAGQYGNYKKRVIWRRLGRSRDRVYEISVSDPIPWRIVDAYLQATPGFGPTERVAQAARKGA